LALDHRRSSSPASEGAASAKRGLLHDDETRALEVLDESLGDDDRHELVGIVDPLAALKTPRKGECVGDIGGGGSQIFVVRHPGRIVDL
jgi:hypothetical protein